MTDKPKTDRFWREIAVAVALKAVLLTILWAVWFSGHGESSLDDQKVASKILTQQPQKEHEHDSVR